MKWSHRASNRIVDQPTPANIRASQQPASFVEVKHGLIQLLRDALASQKGGFQAALSGESTMGSAQNMHVQS